MERPGVKRRVVHFPWRPPMRILLVADIHANWSALQAVAAIPHDICVCLGDLVDYGPEPGPVLEWVTDHAGVCVRGNHDHGAAQHVVIQGRTGYKYLTAVTRPLTRELLGPDGLRRLAVFPVSRTVTLDRMRFLLVHASPRDPLDEYAPPDVEFWTRRLQHVDADVVCVGHTHQPYVLEVGDKLVINPGSVGQPRDSDPRASFAVIQDFKVDLHRLDYPIEETVSAVARTNLAERDKDFLIEVFRTGSVSTSCRKTDGTDFSGA
jgi:putative phosphoesterase